MLFFSHSYLSAIFDIEPSSSSQPSSELFMRFIYHYKKDGNSVRSVVWEHNTTETLFYAVATSIWQRYAKDVREFVVRYSRGTWNLSFSKRQYWLSIPRNEADHSSTCSTDVTIGLCMYSLIQYYGVNMTDLTFTSAVSVWLRHLRTMPSSC